ncbi:MAG: hypothetical protein WKG07_41600 [Hymenobacter sp.]
MQIFTYLFRHLIARVSYLVIFSIVCSIPGHAQTWQWAVGQTLTSSLGTAECMAIIRDAAPGRFVVAGKFSGTIQLGSLLLTSVGQEDIFIARLNAQGNWLQAARAGGADYDYPAALALDADGNAVLTGQFQSHSADFGQLALVNADQTYNTTDIFIARFNSQGQWVQAQRAGGAFSDFSYGGLALDAKGNAVIAGSFNSSTLPLGSFTLTATSAYTPFVARLGPQGEWVQAVTAGNAQNRGTWPTSLCLDQSDNVLIAGTFQGPETQFGTFTLVNADARPGMQMPIFSWPA